MNYKLINGIGYIENITGKKGLPEEKQKILTGHLINNLDECHEVLETMSTCSDIDIKILRSTADYMKERNIPYAITEEKNSRYNHFYVHGKEIVRKKDNSKKLLGNI